VIALAKLIKLHNSAKPSLSFSVHRCVPSSPAFLPIFIKQEIMIAASLPLRRLLSTRKLAVTTARFAFLKK
jgi:hypothetical protein